MDAGLFINFPRDPGQNIYFGVFDGQDIYLKKLPAPPPSPPRINFSSPYKKKGQVQPFPNCTDCHNKHIAMPHGLWLSVHKKELKCYRYHCSFIAVNWAKFCGISVYMLNVSYTLTSLLYIEFIFPCWSFIIKVSSNFSPLRFGKTHSSLPFSRM